jgi:hypothetical protein
VPCLGISRLSTATCLSAVPALVICSDSRGQTDAVVATGEEDGQSLELAFSKKKVEQRKEWLRDFVPGTYLDHDCDEISYSDFVHRELILFSRSDLLRSIPNMLDGLKPGQRKIIFTCFQKNQKKDIKVCFCLELSLSVD